jgi:large subunit ribosomal protein L13
LTCGSGAGNRRAFAFSEEQTVMNTRTTVALKPADVDKKWVVIDAQDAVVGRLASFIALRLRGKHRPDYTPNVDCGDNVVVVNAAGVRFTGRKLEQKTYY